jgi:hypothetical protein
LCLFCSFFKARTSAILKITVCIQQFLSFFTETATNSKEDDAVENTSLKQLWQKVSKAMSKKILMEYRVTVIKEDEEVEVPDRENADKDATPL